MKKILCVLLTLSIAFLASSCSSGKDAQALEPSADGAKAALCEFNIDDFKKYASSETLNEIEKQIETYPQIEILSKAIFKNLEIEVKSAKLNDKTGKGTAVLKIKNKDLKQLASDYITSMVSDYLLGKVDLKDEAFLNEQIEILSTQIEDAPDGEWQKVKVNTKKGSDGVWRILFNDEAENAVMGGAAASIKGITKLS